MWKLHRKYLNVCFNQKFLQTFVPTFNKSCMKLTERLDEMANNGNEFDINHAIGKCTLEMICGEKFCNYHYKKIQFLRTR